MMATARTGGSACPRRRPIASTWCACGAPIPRPRRWSGCAVAAWVAAADLTEPQHWDGRRVELPAELPAELGRVRCGARISRGQLCSCSASTSNATRRPRRWSGCAVAAWVAAADLTEPHHWDGCRVELPAELQAELVRVRCGARISRGQLCSCSASTSNATRRPGLVPELATGRAAGGSPAGSRLRGSSAAPSAAHDPGAPNRAQASGSPGGCVGRG